MADFGGWGACQGAENGPILGKSGPVCPQMEDIYEQNQGFITASASADAGALFMRLQLAQGGYGPLDRPGLGRLLYVPGAPMSRNYGIRSCYVPPAQKPPRLIRWLAFALGVLVLGAGLTMLMALAHVIGAIL